MNLRRLVSGVAMALLLCACQAEKPTADLPREAFVQVSGPDLLTPQGEKLLIRGTNLGNWLNPEGYMFGFKKCNSAGRIDRMLCELVGPDAAADFWHDFKNHYITRHDVEYIASTGANTIRLPFHYKLFTEEDYMGRCTEQDGFERVDSVVNWCRDNGLYLILDMHDAPGGQTGDNIDDSHGYPWLFESERSQELFCSLWCKIAQRYRNEPVILGYELMNEPIAHFFENKEELNRYLQPLYERAVATIREVDPHHIILIGGAQWNSNFQPIGTFDEDPQIIYTCHRYGGDATAEAIAHFIDFRNRTNRPMYMGEIGHNTYAWQADFCKVMEENNIGWTFWPYKKMGESCMMGIVKPEGWDRIIEFAESPRASYDEVRSARPDQQEMRQVLQRFIEQCRLEACIPQQEYIRSIGLQPR